MYDLAIIGGGAAGITAAVYTKMLNKNLSVVVCERLDRILKKLITTGNGQCNITNKNIDISRYHGSDVHFAESVFNRFSNEETIDFFDKIGVSICFDEVGRAYPTSFQASSVVDSLRFAAEEYGVEIKCNCTVNDILPGKFFTLETSNGPISAKEIIVTGGLLSGGEKLGCDGKILTIIKSKGIKTVNTRPSIVQIKTKGDITRSLKGIKVNAAATLISDGKPIKTEKGEILFTDYGLSGPPILQLSCRLGIIDDTSISINLLPDSDFNEVLSVLKKRRQNLQLRTAENFLTGFVNKRVGQVIVKNSGISLLTGVKDITDRQLKTVASMLRDMRFTVTGTNGFNNSQVTSGGISTDEITENLESKKYKGMYFAGEVIDIDGDCGGFILQWAWSTAFITAKSVCEDLQ